MVTKNLLMFREAKRYIPGGVNSPVRAFKSVGGIPLFIKKGKGSKVYSVDGKQYIDYCMSWGALILGHAHKEVVKAVKTAVENGTSFGAPTQLETELAKEISKAFPSIEMVRLVNSGTEACMSAIRLARGYTGRKKIIKFAGCYHGHTDYLLVQAGSGMTTFRSMFSVQRSTSAGVPEDFIKHTIVVPYNNLYAVEKVVKKYYKYIACIIVEPIAGNMGVVLPKTGFLKGLREICNTYKIILIFDEVITGFRVAYGGAQKLFGIKPDLTCLGKIIGGGLPIGAFGGRKEIMNCIAPAGPVYQAGTLSGNPVGVTAGLTTLKILRTTQNIYNQLEQETTYLCDSIKQISDKFGIKIVINQIGSMFSIFFTDTEVYDYNSALKSNIKLYSKFFHSMLNYGVYFPPSQFESCFLSVQHTNSGDINSTIDSAYRVFKKWR